MNWRVNCIVENLFYNNVIDTDQTSFGWAFQKCKYIVCVSTKLLGIHLNFSEAGRFTGLNVFDLGSMIPNIDQQQYEAGEYEFTICGFTSIDETVNLFMMFKSGRDNKCHHLFLNENSYDKTYGLSSIDQLTMGGSVVDVQYVFNNVEQLKTLDNISIVLTDYGFWDIESNQTNSVTYSFKNGLKDYSKCGPFNGRKNKVSTPTLALQDTDSVAEYDKAWSLVSHNNEDKYVCSEFPDVWWLKEIASEDGLRKQFFGCTDKFAVYYPQGGGAADILVGIGLGQFKQFILANPELAQTFMEWMYGQVVYPQRGERYLMNVHEEAAQYVNSLANNKTFSNLKYQVVPEDQLIDDKFNSIREIALAQNPSAQTLYSYCRALEDATTIAQSIGWLMDENALHGKISQWFKENEGATVNLFVESIVDGLIQGHPLLGYFRTYLIDHLKSDFAGIGDDKIGIGIASAVAQSVIEQIQNLIRGKIATALVFGKAKYGMFGGIESYLGRNLVNIDKSSVEYITSAFNVRNEVLSSVRSAEFFSNYNTYNELAIETSNPNLFKIVQDVGFAKTSNLVDDNGKIRLNWEGIKSWLFPAAKQDDETLLKAFVRTQFYRPLFFKWDESDLFSKNTSAYKCHTEKRYVNHDGVECPLVFIGTEVDDQASLLVDGEGYAIKSIQYFKPTNVLKYVIQYDPIKIVDSKFVCNDIEFYVVFMNGKASVVYFNHFQNQVWTANQIAPVHDGEFEVDGVVYKIEGNQVKVVGGFNGGEIGEDALSDKYAQEIDEGKFKFGETWFSVMEDTNGNPVAIHYSNNQDTELKSMYVAQNGKGLCEELDMTFTFNDEDGTVVVEKSVQRKVLDRVVDEWCEFDNKELNLDESQGRTFEWCLANQIVDMQGKYVQFKSALSDLGNMMLYGGYMQINNLGGTICKLRIQNEIQNGKVLSKCYLVKGLNDSTQEQYLGILYDKNMDLASGRTMRGFLNGDKTVRKDQSGGYMFVIKDIDGAWNNCNAIQIAIGDWQRCQKVVQRVGEVTQQNESDVLTVQFSGVLDDAPNSFSLTPLEAEQEVNSSGRLTDLDQKFVVDFELDDFQKYEVSACNGRYVHVICP
jgi:hypothetical protein